MEVTAARPPDTPRCVAVRLPQVSPANLPRRRRKRTDLERRISHFLEMGPVQQRVSQVSSHVMAGALVLNASYEPLCVVPVRRAVILVLKQKAEVIHESDRSLRSERTVFTAPSVIRLIHFVKVPFRTKVPLNRRAVFARDANRCQYCHAPAENIDHVVPRSKGGPHSWDNVVAACRPCNAKKGDSLLENTSMVLRKRPVAPHTLTWMVVAVGSMSPDWEPYLSTGALSA